MKVTRHVGYFAAFSSAVFLYILYSTTNLLQADTASTADSASGEAIDRIEGPIIGHTGHPRYLLKSTQCRIPWYNPFDKTISQWVQNDSVSCEPAFPILTYQDGTMIRLNHNVINKHYSDFTGCSYVPIVLKSNLSDSGYRRVKDRRVFFKNSTYVNEEFVKVTCYNGSSIVYTDYFAFILQKRVSTTTNGKKIENNFSVLMLAYESISSSSFVRSLPKLRAYLMNHRAAEFRVHAKVGENTFPNMLGVFSGKSFLDLKALGWNKSQTLDDFDFAWKEFKNCNYTTLWAEDGALGGSFHYGNKGFTRAQTDYYYRPFTEAYKVDKTVWPNEHCINDRYEVTMIMKYIADFIKMQQHRPFFAFGFIARNTHKDARYINMLESTTLDMFLNIQDIISNNTAVLVFADHGLRMSGIRKTEIGRLESKLPAMYILLPQNLRKKYPNFSANLEENARKLTSHWDVYKTLLHFLSFAGSDWYEKAKNARGISLLERIPSNRSCKDAGIPPRHCPCGILKKISKDTTLVKDAASFSVDFINSLLTHDCRKLNLVDVQEAHRLVDIPQNTTGLYILITTTPANAVFDVTVLYDRKKRFSMESRPIRVNEYGNQSYCVEDRYTKTICYCKNYNLNLTTDNSILPHSSL